MISEGSCHTEDCSNDENSALPSRANDHITFKIKSRDSTDFSQY